VTRTAGGASRWTSPRPCHPPTTRPRTTRNDLGGALVTAQQPSRFVADGFDGVRDEFAAVSVAKGDDSPSAGTRRGPASGPNPNAAPGAVSPGAPRRR
jgi:hypothetical protein